MPHKIPCLECKKEIPDFLAGHLMDAHGLSLPEYLTEHPGAATVSQRLLDAHKAKQRPGPKHPVGASDLSVTMGPVSFPVNVGVPASACLPMPAHYRIPDHGLLGEDVSQALVALRFRRSLYVHGLPGSGKDALLHAFSAMTRTPGMIRQVRPGADVEGWFFARGFTESGTCWEEGEVLKALRDGYLCTDGRRIPYLVLFTDFDRADREQAESVRLITDSIQGRVDGPGGRTAPVLPGTIITGTGNTSGGGDERGRMVSANLLDASLMDRWERVLLFHWMEWVDEEPVLESKFPILAQAYGQPLWDKFKQITKVLREAIYDDKLAGEFSHRALCAILGHATDILLLSGGKPPNDLFKKAVRVWIDKLPDRENRENAIHMMDPHLGLLAVGDISHIFRSQPLVPGVA